MYIETLKKQELLGAAFFGWAYKKICLQNIYFLLLYDLRLLDFDSLVDFYMFKCFSINQNDYYL